LGFALGIGPDGAYRLAEQINCTGSFTEVFQAIGTAVRDVLANDVANLPGKRPEQAELVVLI
jgi:hypothetical protein